MGRLNIELQKKVKVKSYRFVSVLDSMIMLDLMKTLFAVLSVIVIIIVSRSFIKVLAKAIEGNIANETVLSILGLNTIVATSEFLPASVFIAILMVLGRMYKDNEMAVVASAGGGVADIYRAVFMLVFPLCILATGLSMTAMPWAEAKARLLIHEDKQGSDIRGIVAGRFTEHSKGNLIFYTEYIDSDERMSHVFIQNGKGDKSGIVNARYGRFKNLPGGLYLVLDQGERIHGIPGEMDFVIEKFTEYAVRIKKKTAKLHQKRKAIPSAELWASDELIDVVEIQKRLAIPFSVVFLSFLAVPLAKLSPRGGIYNSLLVAFGVYFVFGNLRRVSHSWVINEFIPVWLGYSGVYLLLLLLGGVLLVRLYGIKWVDMGVRERGVM